MVRRGALEGPIEKTKNLFRCCGILISFYLDLGAALNEVLLRQRDGNLWLRGFHKPRHPWTVIPQLLTPRRQQILAIGQFYMSSSRKQSERSYSVYL